MKRVFADTSYYIALCNPKDRWHAVAKSASANCHSPVVTTEYVVLELGNYFCQPDVRSLFLALLANLRSDLHTTLLPTSSRHFEAGLALYQKRGDKAWSLTDCISIAVMRELKIDSVLTCDRHFGQAGFQLLMATP